MPAVTSGVFVGLYWHCVITILTLSNDPREALTPLVVIRGKIGGVEIDSATIMPILLVLIAIAVVSVAVASVFGKLTLRGMPAPMTGEVFTPATDGSLSAQTITTASLPLAFRGYNVEHVDRLLDAASAAITARDKQIAELTGTADGELTTESQDLIDAVAADDDIEDFDSESSTSSTDSAALDDDSGDNNSGDNNIDLDKTD